MDRLSDTLIKKLYRKSRYYYDTLKNRTVHARMRKYYLKEKDLEKYFKGRRGVEVGGPSQIFSSRGILPVYDLIDSLDGCNFTNNTVWEGAIKDETYRFHEGKTGRQYICEGCSLDFSADGQYDFLLSSHSLEHHANVIKTLREWKRVVKPGGLLLIVVPEKKYTFDHRRDYTPFGHFIEDEANDVDETDLTHLDEILRLHDLFMDPGIDNFEAFKRRSLDNFHNRCFHQHLFNFGNLSQLADHLQLEVVATNFTPPYHNIVFLRKR